MFFFSCFLLFFLLPGRWCRKYMFIKYKNCFKDLSPLACVLKLLRKVYWLANWITGMLYFKNLRKSMSDENYRVPTGQLDLNSLTFPDLTARIEQVSQINFEPTIIGFYRNMSRNIWTNLVHLSQIKIPWLSLTLDKKILKFPDFPWLSRKKYFSLIFPDGRNPEIITMKKETV